ncbi:MAG: TonB family protein [Acidobacteria bacterium OLB17]|nr:MAG: TonB family protein [Acidobacteria bacterium OLB17]
MSAPLTVLNFFVEYYKWLAQKDQDGQNASSLKGSASWATVVNLIPPGYKEKMREPKDVVRLLVYLGADGKVGPILVLKGLPNGLTEKAIENLQQLKFTPARKNGVPINVVRIVEYTVTAL